MVEDQDLTALVERCRSGDGDAWEDMVLRLRPRLEKWVRRWVRDPDLAGDAVQTTLMQVWRGLPGLRDPEAFVAWVYRLLHNASCQTLRSLAAGGSLAVPLEEGMADFAVTAPDSDLRLVLDQAVERLPREYREAFLMVDLLRSRDKLNFLGMARTDDVVPLAMEVGTLDLHSGQIGIGDLDPGGVDLGVEMSADLQSCGGGGVGDQVDDDLMALKGTTSPVFRDVREKPMLNLVPFAGPGRKVAYRD